MHLVPIIAGLPFTPGIRGILDVLVGFVVLAGSVYLLLGTNVGARLGLLIAFAGLFGWLTCLSFFWWLSPPGNGPRGNNAQWKAVEVYVNGSDTAKTREVGLLPPPTEFPTPAQILADHPELEKDFPNGFVLSDLQSSHPEIVSQYLGDLDLNGWRLVPQSSAGEAQASADTALVAAGVFKGPTEYKKLNTFDFGGKPTRAEYCPDAKGGNFLPDDPICRVQYKLNKLFNFHHPTHYAIVQVQAVIPQVTKPGEPPPTPVVDPNAPVISVVMVRILGNVRFIPFLYFAISLSGFIFFVLVLHYRDKTLMKNKAAAEAATQGA